MRITPILSLTIVALIAPQLVAQDVRPPVDVRTLEFADHSTPRSLTVRLHWGRITLHGHDANEVRFETRIAEPSNEARQLSLPSGYEISALETRIEFKAAAPQEGVFAALDVTVFVPSGVTTELFIERGGDIAVEHFEGSLEITNLNGSVRLDDVSGAAQVNASNGEITATFRYVPPGLPLTFATLNGGVDITLPADIRADLHVIAPGDDIRTEFDVEIVERADGPVALRGPHRGRPTQEVLGRLNGGGPLLYIQTHNGPVRIRKGANLDE